MRSFIRQNKLKEKYLTKTDKFISQYFIFHDISELMFLFMEYDKY